MLGVPAIAPRSGNEDARAMRYCGWRGGRLAVGESLALTRDDELPETCDLCYLLAHARQSARAARLSPEERAALLEPARHVAATLQALAGLPDAAQ